ncbi:hypothetical protein niasHT_035592 [Heterodera trifolii]|uniref:TRAF3-interacting protein 1 n=1 Tax=Heterodera trifolii TaxID=157864 RepID=A0ABD2J5K0_9BILA
MGSTDRTKALFSTLIQRPTLTDQLLQRPPFKFIHDIVHETLRVTGFLDGLFTSDELDSTKAGSSRDNKMAFLQKLIDALNMDGHLDDVKPAKIVAGKEAEMTNLLLQSLASEATMYAKEEDNNKQQQQLAVKKSASHSSASSKSKSTTVEAASSSLSASKSKNDDDEKRKSKKESSSSRKDKEKKEEEHRRSSLTKHRSKDKVSSSKISRTDGNHRISNETAAEKKPSTDKEKRKKRSDGLPKKKSASSIKNANDAAVLDENVLNRQQKQLQQQQMNDDNIIYNNMDLQHETRTTPARESSGGTSKGGDDSGIAEEMSADSERHNPDKDGTPFGGQANMADFIEVHPSSSSSPTPMLATRHGIRPGTAMGRPQTAIGRPGTAVARMAPPKPKKIVIPTNNNLTEEEDQLASTDKQQQQQQIALIFEENAEKKTTKETENFLIAEDDDDQLFLGAAAEGANVTNLRQGDEHGILVNRIVENTRMLEEKHLQEDGPFVEADEPDLQEQRRVRVEIESVQRVLQRATQNVQPLVRTMEFAADDFDTMLRELEECRKQSLVVERKLQERSTGVSSEVVALSTTLRALDNDIREVREHLARSSANMLENERKINALLGTNYAKK